jgi:hypothetical protein
MSGLEGIADHAEIEALRGEFPDAITMHDYDRLASLFTQDGAVRMPYVTVEHAGREQIRAGIGRMQGLLDCFVQITHPSGIQLDGDPAPGPCLQPRTHPVPRRADRMTPQAGRTMACRQESRTRQ